MDSVYCDPQSTRSDLNHLGVKALTHFCATMSYQNGTIRVDVHQCTCLVEKLGCKIDAELCGYDSESSLSPTMLCIETCHSFAARCNICPGRLVDFLPKAVQRIICNRLNENV